MGENKINFGDKSIVVNGTALIFTNPAIPYFWERISDKQKGYMYIFTASFCNRFGNISDFSIFQFDAAAVVKLAEVEITARLTNSFRVPYCTKLC